MTGKERMICALTGGTPDRVPVAPDMSCMIPCRRSSAGFQGVLLNQNPPLWKAYLDAVKYFGTDAWFMYGTLSFKSKSQCETRQVRSVDQDGRITVREIIKTPKGELSSAVLYPVDDCSVSTEKLIKNFKADFPKFRYLFPEITGYDDSILREQQRQLGDLGLLAIDLYPPGLHIFNNYFAGNLEAAVYAYYDEPELFEEMTELYTKQLMQQLEMILDAKPESILTGGSGSITMQSPQIWEELAFPVLKNIIHQAHQAGAITGVHSCGKERYLVKKLSEETELDYINPLEMAPMGDCDLGEIKRLYGDKIALMGNLHTTDTMLRGSTADIRREALKAILAGGIGGGFALSTGDQTPRDTPDENIFELVKTVQEFGSYPLNVDRIETEIQRLS